ncbi:hypothetical protein ACLGA7_06445 [Helicobacter pylori]|uniref:hypothetical protein n=1 Tax=Helicobacter pylori TaxID=210 RepID=UPI00115802F5|nr:hypothetical protein [Helicobacter pylori]QDK11766.1 hypothetical protein D8X81_07145 [Helicobacter pylori]
MKFFKIPKLHLNSKEHQENIFRKFYSLKNYRFITKLFSLIVKNAFSVLDFYSFILLVLLFISFVFNFFNWGFVLFLIYGV